MGPGRYAQLLGLVLGVGLVARLALAFATHGLVFDLDSYAIVKDALHAHPLHVYALVNGPTAFRWPYPPGFFPLILLGGAIADVSGLAFTELIRVPAILADLAIAWIVQDFLGRQGASERTRLVAAAAVALGPSFLLVSGYNGQLDSVAILPAVAALAIWARMPAARRAPIAGALIGVGAVVKVVPLLMVLALLPSCRSIREGIRLAVPAVAIPAVALAPFLIATPAAVRRLLDYHSLPGLGGISLLAQPDLARIWLLRSPDVQISQASHLLQGHVGQIIGVVAVATAVVVLARLRPSPIDGAVLLWLTTFSFTINFGPRYALWGLPFFLMAGGVREAVLLQALLLVPNLLIYTGPFSDSDVLFAYVPFMFAAWGAFVVFLALTARRLARQRAIA